MGSHFKVARWIRARWLIVGMACIAGHRLSALELDAKAVEAKLQFNMSEPRCLPLTASELKINSDVLQGLDTVMDQVIQYVNRQDGKGLASLYHERLGIDAAKMDTVFALMESNYGRPYQASLFEAYLLGIGTGKIEPLGCEKSRLSVLPQSGYPLQAAFWLQITGDREIGRLIMTMVPTPRGWRIGSFHAWQWTNGGKDYEGWFKEAEGMRQGNPLGAYLHAGIAAKLLTAKPYMTFADQAAVTAFMDGLSSQERVLMQVRGIAGSEDIAYFGTTLVDGGIGALLRINLKAEASAAAMREDCQKKSEKIFTDGSLKFIKGVRCSHHLPGETLEKDGVLGSLFYPKPEQEKSGKSAEKM